MKLRNMWVRPPRWKYAHLPVQNLGGDNYLDFTECGRIMPGGVAEEGDWLIGQWRNPMCSKCRAIQLGKIKSPWEDL